MHPTLLVPVTGFILRLQHWRLPSANAHFQHCLKLRMSSQFTYSAHITQRMRWSHIDHLQDASVELNFRQFEPKIQKEKNS